MFRELSLIGSTMISYYVLLNTLEGNFQYSGLSSIPYWIPLKINIFGHQKYSIRGYNENANFMTIGEIIIDSFCKNYKWQGHNSYRILSSPKKKQNLTYESVSSDYDSQFMTWISSN